MIKKPNQRLHRVEGAGIKFKLIKGLFKEIIAGGNRNIEKEMKIQMQNSLRRPGRHGQRGAYIQHNVVKMLKLQNREKY